MSEKKIVKIPYHGDYSTEAIASDMASQGFETLSITRLPEDMTEPGLRFSVEVEPFKKEEEPSFPPVEELSKRIDDAINTLQMAKILQKSTQPNSVSLMAFIKSAIHDLEGTKKWEQL
jgi:hypothetical protein